VNNLSDPNRPSVLIIATLDTKATEADYARQVVETEGGRALLLDIGIVHANLCPPDITREEFSALSGVDLEIVADTTDISVGIAALADAAARGAPRILDAYTISGVMGIGGGKGTAINTAFMKALPFGLPKVMVTSASPGNARHFIGYSDILMLFSPADIMGLNPVTRPLIANAARAVAAMAKCYSSGRKEKPFVAISAFGVTTPAVLCCKERIEAAGYETVVYPASGLGGRAMEQAIRDGNVIGILDLTTTELADEMMGGIAGAGQKRLEAAADVGVPQVVAPGAMDMVNFGPPDTVPGKYGNRRFYRHSPVATLMRTTPEENAQLGKLTADKLNRASSPTVAVIPLKGFSAYDCPHGHWPDPQADRAYINALKTDLSPGVGYQEVDDHINGKEFCRIAVDQLLGLLGQPR
jgi:uncharacterized protein (UPF0261 family)